MFFELDADVIKMVKIIDMINENGWQDEVYKSKKPLKIKRLTTVIVPLTLPFSNSFYQNLTDIYALKELLYNEGIADYNGLPLIKPDNSNTSLLPQGY